MGSCTETIEQHVEIERRLRKMRGEGQIHCPTFNSNISLSVLRWSYKNRMYVLILILI